MICPAFACFITTHNKLSIEKEKNDKLFKSAISQKCVFGEKAAFFQTKFIIIKSNLL